MTTDISRKLRKVMIAEASPDIVSNVLSQTGTGGAPFRATFAEAIADFAVGEYFTSAQTGELRTYKRVASSPYYQDQGDAAAPGSQAQIDAAAALNQAAVEAVEARQDDVEAALAGKAARDLSDGGTVEGNLAIPPAPMVLSQRPALPSLRARAGLRRSDLFYLGDVPYLASNPNAGSDVGELVQEWLLHCYLIARNIKNDAWDNNVMRTAVRAVLPRGKYNTKTPILVPPRVELDMRGLILRLYDESGEVATKWDGNTATKALANLSMPTLIFTSASQGKAINLYCQNGGTYGGAGVVAGKCWEISEATIVGGSGYQVGDVLTGANGDVGPFYGFQLTVSGVDGSGAPTACTLTSGGAYAFPIELQKRVWTSEYGFDVFDNSYRYKLSGGSGTGAVASVTWADDFQRERYRGPPVVGDCYINHLRIVGGDRLPTADPTYYFPILVQPIGLNVHIDHIETNGGTIGMYMDGVADVFGKTWNFCYPNIGIQVQSSSNINCPSVVLDSCLSRSLDLDKSTNVHLKGSIFFSDSNQSKDPKAPAHSGHQLRVGAQSSTATNANAACVLDFDFYYAGFGASPGSPACYLDYSRGCTIIVRAPNVGRAGDRAPGPKFTNALATIGSNWEGSNLIEGIITNVTGAIFTGAGLVAGETAPRCGVRVYDDKAPGWCGMGGRYVIEKAAAPTAADGQGKAIKGSTYTDILTGITYVNQGTAAAPRWLRGPHAYESAVQQSVTGTTAETTLATITIPAGTLGPNGQVEVQTLWSNTNSANNKLFRVRANGTQISVNTVSTSASATFASRLANRNSVSSQVANPSGASGGNSAAVVTTTIDTDTTDLTITITGTLASAADTMALESYRVLVTPAP